MPTPDRHEELWVSCAERQPEPGGACDGKKYLCLLADGDMKVLYRVRYLEDDDEHETVWMDGACFHYYQPTHWRNLPAPPEKP